MEWRTSGGGWEACTSARINGLVRDGQQARRRQSGARGKAGALEREAARRLARAERQEVESRRLMRKVRRELGLDKKDVWGAGVRLRLSGDKRPRRRNHKQVKISKGGRPLPRYRHVIVDKRGRTALFFRIRYVGFKSKMWRTGCTVDHSYYILREHALELVRGNAAFVSNMGKDADEIGGCWKLLEEVERAYRSNAKVQYRIILNLPHELSPEQRLALVTSYCERQFGRYGLPFVAALHKPDEGGDARNYHVHLCFSTRPVERLGSYEWEFSPEKVTELAAKENLLSMRAEAAAQLNRACRKADLNRRYSHLSYSARQLDVLAQAHLGPERTAAYRSGDDVKLAAQNAVTIARNDAVHASALAQQAVALARAAQIGTRLDFLLERRPEQERVRSTQVSVEVTRAKLIRQAEAAAEYEQRSAALQEQLSATRRLMAGLQRAAATRKRLAGAAPSRRMSLGAARERLAELLAKSPGAVPSSSLRAAAATVGHHAEALTSRTPPVRQRSPARQAIESWVTELLATRPLAPGRVDGSRIVAEARSRVEELLSRATPQLVSDKAAPERRAAVLSGRIRAHAAWASASLPSAPRSRQAQVVADHARVLDERLHTSIAARAHLKNAIVMLRHDKESLSSHLQKTASPSQADKLQHTVARGQQSTNPQAPSSSPQTPAPRPKPSTFAGADHAEPAIDLAQADQDCLAMLRDERMRLVTVNGVVVGRISGDSAKIDYLEGLDQANARRLKAAQDQAIAAAAVTIRTTLLSTTTSHIDIGTDAKALFEAFRNEGAFAEVRKLARERARAAKQTGSTATAETLPFPEAQAVIAFSELIRRGPPGIAILRRIDRSWQQWLLEREDHPDIRRALCERPRDRDDDRRTLRQLLGHQAQPSDGDPRVQKGFER